MFATKDGNLLLRNARAVLPEGVAEHTNISIENGRIARISRTDGETAADSSTVFDLEGLTLYPGFVDVHIHGAVGVDVMEASDEDLQRVALFLARNGVTSWLPTLVPAPAEDYRRAVSAIESLMRAREESPAAARAVGLHYEGPFINEAQCGALRTRFFRKYESAGELEDLVTPALETAARMMTLAPEVAGGVELVRELTSRGWIVSIGHTRAGVEVLERAREAGARHMTHFPNAMPGLHHREPGPVGWGLTNDRMSVDLIADGVHSDPLMLRLVLRCKTPRLVSLISDSVAPTGLGDGAYRVWGETIRVEGRRTSNERGSIAGSVITMRDAASLVATLGFDEADIARMASLNPSRLIGIEQDCGSIEEGKRADLTALDAEGRVRLTLVGGRIAFET